MKDISESVLVIQPWMVTELKLKGNELLVFAIIHNFSSDGESVFFGSLDYLATWCNSTKQGIIKSLNSLVQKGFITKTECGVGQTNKYSTKFTSKQSLMGIKQSLIEPLNKVEQTVKQSLINNKYIIKEDIKKDNKKGKSKKEKFLDSISSKLQEYDFKQTVEEKILDFYEMWYDNKVVIPIQSIEAQLNLLATMGLNEQLNSIDTSIRQGWRSLAYENSNTSRRGFVDTAPQDLKWNKEQRELHKNEKGMSF